MKMCLGSCTLPVEEETYKGMIKDALAFLMGKNRDLSKSLKEKMQTASENEQFELAAQYRDQLFALDKLNSREATSVSSVDEADVIGLHLENGTAAFHVLMVRDGRVIGGENFLAKSPIQSEAETIEAFMLQYYDNRMLPKEFVTAPAIDAFDKLLTAIGPQEVEALTRKSKLTNPRRGAKLDLLKTAEKNAQYFFRESQRQSASKQTVLKLVQEALGLDDLPHRIECIDISNIQGTDVVASCVCFVEGKPAKDLYRRYTIKELADGVQDDFASVYEVVRRRLLRAAEYHDAPDLLVIDGGKGQLNAALKAKTEVESPVKIVSLAKARSQKNPKAPEGTPIQTYERIFLPGQEQSFALKPASPEFRLFTQLRDEAHRFAITFHRKKRGKRMLASELDEVPGIGPKLRQRLLETFGDLEKVKRASFDDLLKVKGVSEAVAVAVHAKFQQ